MLWCVPVDCSFWGVFAFCVWTPIQRCVMIEIHVARQDFRKCCICPMYLIMEYLCVPYAWYACLQQPHLGCVTKHSAVRGLRIHSHCKKLLIEFMVCFYATMWPPGNIFSGSHGAGSFLVPNLFQEKPHLLLPLCLMYYGKYILASELRILFHGMLVCTWIGRAYLEILDLLLLLFSWVRDLSVVTMNSS